MNPTLWTVLSVLLIHNIIEVTAQNSPWFPDHCETSLEYKCGNFCVKSHHSCNCGGVDWGWFKDKEDKYCCVPPGDSQCTKDTDHDSDYNVNCSTGVLLPWHKSCHGDCIGSPLIKKNNCQYDCLARTDEVSDKQNERNLDFETLKLFDLQKCTTAN